jgi:fibronectin type 3 domain-containing protein
VENAKRYFIVECFNSSYKSKWVKKIKRSLPLWGTVGYDGSSFFVITGKENGSKKDSADCYAITRYNSQWKKTGEIKVRGCYTTSPFAGGSCSVAFYKDMLYVKSCRLMYNGHQSNITIVANKKTMTLVDYPRELTSYALEEANEYGYVSHSFNQIARIDQGKLVAVDHGDAYPRAIALSDIRPQDLSLTMYENTANYHLSDKQYEFLSIPGEEGDNRTGACLGDFQVSDSNYLVCGTSVKQKNAKLQGKAKQNVFLSVMNKQTKKVSFRFITSYSNSRKLGNPYLTKLSNNRFMLIWTNGKKLYYQQIDGEGKNVGKRHTLSGAKLSSCEPIVANGKIQWYWTKNKKVHFYSIPVSGISNSDSMEQKIEKEVNEISIGSIENVSEGIQFHWDASQNAAGYVVYRRTLTGSWEKLAKIPSANTTVYTDTTAENDICYFYKVFTYTKNAEGFYYDINTLALGTICQRLSAPTLISATPETINRYYATSSGKELRSVTTVTLQFSGELDENTRVQIYRKEGDGEWTKLSRSTTQTTYKDRTATAGTTYEYKAVISRNANVFIHCSGYDSLDNFTSAFSNTISVTA